MATLQITTKTKNDYLRNWLKEFNLDDSIIENYDSVTIILDDDDIKSLKKPEEAKVDIGLIGKINKKDASNI